MTGYLNILAEEGFAGTTRLPYITAFDFQDVNWKTIFQFNYSSADFEIRGQFCYSFLQAVQSTTQPAAHVCLWGGRGIPC